MCPLLKFIIVAFPGCLAVDVTKFGVCHHLVEALEEAGHSLFCSVHASLPLFPQHRKQQAGVWVVRLCRPYTSSCALHT